MISINAHLHSYLCSGPTATQVSSHCNQNSSRSGSGYTYVFNTLNPSPQVERTLYFDHLQNFTSLISEVSSD